MKKKVIKKKHHVEIHGLSAKDKAELVRVGVPMVTFASGVILLPLSLPIGMAIALGGTIASGVGGIVLRDKLVGIFRRHESKKRLKRVM